ncbi:MAG: branched-chain amino acid transaminase [Candidatus Dormibacteria bacterium]
MTQMLAPAADARTRREESWVYLDGEIVRYADAKLGLMTHGLHYGTGCIEGIRANWNADRNQLYVFRMPEHYERLADSARILRMSLPMDTDGLCDLTLELLRRNGARDDMYIRPICFKGAEEIGVRLHDVSDSFAVYSAPLGPYVNTGGIRCVISSWRRIDDTMAPVRTKCTGLYVNSALAKSEALQGGFDEAIFLTADGHVCEGSGENILIVREGVFITPPPSDNILEGITSASVTHLIREELGLDVVERSIDRTELYVADEVLMCGTAAHVAAVVEIDRIAIGDGTPGPLTRRVQELYAHVCLGENPKYADWLAAVY